MRKAILVLVLCGMAGVLSACGSTPATDHDSEKTISTASVQEKHAIGSTDTERTQTTTDKKALVAYFAYTENIGNTDVISSASLNRDADNETGNLQVMSQVIQEQTGADMLHILVSEPYDPEYDVMRNRAYEELNNDSFPGLQSETENPEDYDVIYIGTPVWAGAMPRPVASFLHEHNLSGKTIIPFGIHLGSGFGSILQEMKELAPDATIADGFTIRADTSNQEVREEFTQWLHDMK